MGFAVFLLVLATACHALWPQPKSITYLGEEYPFCGNTLGFIVDASSPSAPLLNQAVARYLEIVFRYNASASCTGAEPFVVRLIVNETTAPVLDDKTDESYTLQVEKSNDQQALIVGASAFGVMRGLETLAQLVDRTHSTWQVPGVAVADAPRFPFRGFMHDTARHFLRVPVLETLIDALVSSKFNVFHWHLTDDESCPYDSARLPQLRKGAYGGLASHTYSQQQVADLIEYGRVRGVRVVPEFDTPGHAGGMGVGYPELVTECWANGAPSGTTGPVNPTVPGNFDLMATLWNETAKVFPDPYVHLGGDEVSFDCWQSNPDVQKWMQAKNWTDYALLEQYYEQKLIEIVNATGKKYIVWQEIFDNGLKIDPHTIVDVWKGGNWQEEMSSVTSAGYGVILAAPWYLNYIQDPYPTQGDWMSYYLVEPLNFTGSEEQKKLVLGGEGTMWAEFVGNANVVSRTWPRAATVGERLWSLESVRDVEDAKARLQQYRCELLRRGIAAEPVTGPGYCQHELDE